ncbi:TetR/AcrR family transcriptional regulator C-terminal domain-containing protein [Amycolatopsis azurea]|uniref:TetR family transcriptional regulator n=1 Tax=Amycolatopsis azurea DSM 43854 TaxID=1238180 RepID=M2PR37_9PSEU|nr:TetR/AcrR family transcriptional regulator C-terminal domain-containing protein [Amycolatopsis azurea]EMD27023.1 tetracycline repressor protein [Amycolatopsis azurea DSM 43854]OOC08759.1 TetR family transcriptional regulator [Amycolatopsis azurea DSM 43854]
MARKGSLDLAKITEAAVELLDETGLAELSTRRLAAKLGVSSPTLYWHVKDKAELLDLVAEAICADAFEIDRDLPWREQLASGLRQFRALLLRHRDAAALLRERPPTGPHRLGHIETTARILLEAGFSEEDTAGISRLLTAHVLASVETLPARKPDEGFLARLAAYPHVSRLGPAFAAQSSEDLFDLGVEVILDGLAARLRRS